ncbi:hypothetical protein [Streptomyces sp. NBC_01451]|uniref:hypothetical protein n=1 Tax=Streptomyces sp. NBC_01451 TaxID=2903872 RepID=UPI002E37D030|nr:hypothetical protein [Streptomyces sp. NBC_01451]
MSRLAQRYWASLTDAGTGEPAPLTDRGRRKDVALWRRYLASLLDFELTEPEEAPARTGAGQERAGAADRYTPGPTVYYTLDRTVDVAGAEPPSVFSRRPMVRMGLAAAVVLGTGFGVSVVLAGHRTENTPIVIEASPSPTVNRDAVVEDGEYAWVPPKGWRRDVKTGTEVHYTSPDGKQEVMAKSAPARGDLMETWKESEANARQGEHYKRILLEEAMFRGYPSIVWEYTFTLGGEPWHALLLGFNAGGKSYQISTWYQSAVEKRALRTYMAVRASFIAIVPAETASATGRPSSSPTPR